MTYDDDTTKADTEAPPPAGHNTPNKLEGLTAADLRSLKLKAGNLVRVLGDIAERRQTLNDEAAAVRSELKEMGLNKNAIAQAEGMEKMRRAGNTKPLDGYFVSLRILSAAINLPIDANGQFGLLLDEVVDGPEPAVTEVRAGNTTNIPPAGPPLPKKKPRQQPKDGPIMDASAGPGSGRSMSAPDPDKVFGKTPPAAPPHTALAVPVIPDTIARPRGVKDIEFSDAVIAGRTAFRAGEERKCPDTFMGELGDVWERAWDYEQALSGQGAANAVVH